MVGARGFEPPTPCAQGRCATRLRYAPTRLKALEIIVSEVPVRWAIAGLFHFQNKQENNGPSSY
jgi:hypothetical protein